MNDQGVQSRQPRFREIKINLIAASAMGPTTSELYVLVGGPTMTSEGGIALLSCYVETVLFFLFLKTAGCVICYN